MEKFEKLGLCEHVLKAISNKKFAEPTEIQKKTIPLVLKGKDVVAGSATGSGKTLAFGAGMIKKVSKGKGIQGLVLTPTRELAEQVSEALEEFSYYKNLEIVSVYGGVSIDNQKKKLAYADIVVATPGRLLDHLRQNSVDLSGVKFLVLDEADRMWDMGFKDDVSKIVEACPEGRQTMLFSATISGDLEDFSGKYMRSPVEVAVEHYVDTSKLRQVYYDVDDREKFSFLVHLLKSREPLAGGHGPKGLAMVFCNTRSNSDFVDKNLRLNGVDSRVIHGGLDQKKRMRVLKEFSDGKASVIVCTDVAARGLDIKGVSEVYNYDLPKDHRDYVHRVGRTARAGESGLAVNVLASRDYDNFSNILRKNEGLKIEREETPHFRRVSFKVIERKGRGGVRGKEKGMRNREAGSRGRSEGCGNVGSFGRKKRGERNKRSGGKDGFRGRKRKG